MGWYGPPNCQTSCECEPAPPFLECNECSGNVPQFIQVTLTGMADGTCVTGDCATLDGTYVCQNVANCVWTSPTVITPWCGQPGTWRVSADVEITDQWILNYAVQVQPDGNPGLAFRVQGSHDFGGLPECGNINFSQAAFCTGPSCSCAGATISVLGL